ncbi:MAG TPA: energy transducer TonB [Candidatus Sulfotelmatobacter sp.]|nr:energy transducer TonB [Candidatus Sulfotelmatobacter sp.]
MSSTLQLEEPVCVQDHESPKLLVEWSPRWPEFVESIGPALSRSEARLAGEAPFGLVPFRIMLPSYLVEGFLILAAIFVQAKVAALRPYVVPQITNHDVIYYSGDELPRTEDLGGAEAGRTGVAGGEESHHRTQTIKIARGGSMVSKVVDAPNLKLPSSRDAVANLLAIRPDPGPPPAEGLRSARSFRSLQTTIVAPSPNVTRDYTRNGVQLDSVVAPAPSVTRDRPLIAPNLNTTLIPPAPEVKTDHALVAPALAPAVVPPSPNVMRDRAASVPSLNTSVVAPSPAVPRDPFRSAPSVSGNVVPPAPSAVTRQMSSAPVQVAESVVPPPVSAPERAGVRNPKLNLPAPSVVAPPPSADMSTDMRRLSGGSIPDTARGVVPPPPSASNSGSLVSSLIGKIFGTSTVVPPPPSVSSKSTSGGSTPSLASNVVPPPPAVDPSSQAGNPNGKRNGTGASLGSNVVAPPPSVGMPGGSGNRSRSGAAPYLGNTSVVPPPPSLPGKGGGTGTTGGGAGSPGGTLLANNVVPPPPSVGSGTSNSGTGFGRKGTGLGAPSDMGSNLAPANAAGSGKDAGTIVSSQPGTKVGVPPNTATGSLAMSPTGGEKSGIGGSGGGTGIGHGAGPGSSVAGAGSGSAKSGTGRGTDINARGGISPTTGPGGAGSTASGTPAVRGVEISGGSGIVTLPSFGPDPAGNDPSPAGRSSLKAHSQSLDVTIVATATSGGPFEPYKNLLKGETASTYFNTSLGTVVMQFADESANDRGFRASLTSPSALRNDLPDGLPKLRMILSCTLDASGNLKNFHVLEPADARSTAKILMALRSWKFQPAMKNNQPVEVTAILGFGIDTNDRF